MNNRFKRNVIVAASAAAVMSLALATPSLAHSGRGSYDGTSTTGWVARTQATVPVTITGVPTTVTQLGQIMRGAKFVAYSLAADATALPATQPTTGGHSARVIANVAADSRVSYAVIISVPVTAGTSKVALYNAAGVGALVTVTVDAAGVATATSSVALTTAYSETTSTYSKSGFGHGKRGGRR